jgi:hypothetical protein
MTTPLLTLWFALLSPLEGDYDHARAQLDAALDQVGQVSTEDSIAALDQGLAALGAYPLELAADLDGLDQLDDARMSLVWLHLAQGDADAAKAAMDAAIRAGRGHLRAASGFGPMVRELYDERIVALGEQGSAIIEVDCRVPCQVIIDERRSANPSEPLYLGHHRVWVAARESDADLQYFDVVLETPGATEMLVYEIQVEPRQADPLKPSPASGPIVAPARKRLLPRWAEILGLSLGAVALSSGVVLLALDGKCGDSACTYLWENTVRGAVIVGAGGGILLGFGAVLTVDEARVRRTDTRQVMLTWTLRF